MVSPRTGCSHQPRTLQWDELSQCGLDVRWLSDLWQMLPRRVCGAGWGAWSSPCCRCPVPGMSGWAVASSAQILPLPAGPRRVRVGFCREPAKPAPLAASHGLRPGAGPTAAPWGQLWGFAAPRALPVPAGKTEGAAVPTLSPCPRLPPPTESHGWLWDTGTWLVRDTPVMGQQWEPAGDSERLLWVAAGLLWHGGEEDALAAPPSGSLGPAPHAVSPVGAQGARELALVTRLRWDPPAQLTDPAGNRPAALLEPPGCYQSSQSGTGLQVPAHWGPAPPQPPLGHSHPAVWSTGGWRAGGRSAGIGSS